MKIQENAKIPNKVVQMDGAKAVSMKVLIGPEEGSANIIMRKFTVAPGGYTPYHTHQFEHIIKVDSGIGALVDSKGNERLLDIGKSAYVAPYEKHQFKNTGEVDFEFLCIIPNPDKDCSA